MNVAKAIETAVADGLRRFADVGAGTVICPWRSLKADSATEAGERKFPRVEPRCGMPRVDASQTTFMQDCAILFGTKTDDDKDHAFIVEIEDAVQGYVDALFAQFRSGVDGEELAAFKAHLAAELGGNFNFGGLTMAEGQAPRDVDGYNMIGITLQVHYSRKEF